VVRNHGNIGPVLVPFRTVGKTAEADVDFEGLNSNILFEHDEIE